MGGEPGAAGVGGEREYAWEAAVWGVQLDWARVAAEVGAQARGDGSKPGPGPLPLEAEPDEEDEEATDRRIALLTSHDLKDPDFEVRWDACRDMAKLGKAAEPFMPVLEEVADHDAHFDVARAARKALRELRQAKQGGWAVAPVRPARRLAAATISDAEAARELASCGVAPAALKDLPAVKRLALKVRRLRGMDARALAAEHGKLGLPAEHTASREVVLARLVRAAAWSEMPLAALREECRKAQLAEDCDAAGEESQALELSARLFREACVAAWEASGVGVARLGSFDLARRVVERGASLRDKPDAELLRECEVRGYAAESGASREELLTRLCRVVLWEALPLDELRRDCSRSGALELAARPCGGDEGSEDQQRRDMIERLLLLEMAAPRGAAGAQLLRLGSPSSAARFLEEVSRIERLGSVELHEECWQLGLPLVPRPREQFVRLLCTHAWWAALPLKELQKEWDDRAALLKADGIEGPVQWGGESVQRGQLLEALRLASCVDGWKALGIPVRSLASLKAAASVAERWSRLDKMGAADLHTACRSLGVHPLLGAEREELLRRVKQAVVWSEWPFGELVRECCANGVDADVPETRRQELMLRLAQALRWVAPSPDRATLAHFAALDLPPTATLDEVKRAFRQMALKHHPDKNASAEEATRAFRRIAEAYEVLRARLET